MPKISVFSNMDDWMQIYVNKEMVYNDHISRFYVSEISTILNGLGIEHTFEESEDPTIDSGEDRSEYVNLEGKNLETPDYPELDPEEPEDDIE